jgi:hypothetical protein
MAGDFVDAYERLKLEMDRLKKHEEELDFFALELQSRRVLHGDWKRVAEFDLFGIKIALVRPALGLPIALYGALCDYGRSYVQPLYGMLLMTAVGALIAWPRFGAFKLKKALGLSVANTFGLLGFRKDFIDPGLLTTLPGALKVVAGLQTVVGAVLLFLFGLAVRNRFRMK